MTDTYLPDSQALRAALDRFYVGVAIVGDDGSLFHVNDAARGMLAEGSHVRNHNGRLRATSTVATNELLRAIGLTRANTASANGIGVPLPGRDGDVAAAHVLPLARAGNSGERLATAATAAVFLVRADRQVEPELTAIAQSYRLTQAEIRLLKRLLLGETVIEAADALNVAVTTARTHMKNLLAKTGTLRQTQLIALVHRLAPPVHWSGADRQLA